MAFPPAPRTYKVKSFGCQMNVYDGERMAELLAAQGMTARRRARRPIWSCSTPATSAKRPWTEKVYSDIGRLRRDDGTTPLIAVAGCVAQAEGEEIMARAPSVRWSSARRPITACPRCSPKPHRGERVTDTDMPADAKFDALPARRRSGPPHSSRCRKGATSSAPIAWCPIRAAPKSPARSSCLDRRSGKVGRAGAREITLLGQNVNAWNGEDGKGLRDRPRRADQKTLARLPDLKRIRYTTSHPNDMTDGLIAAHAEVEKLMPFLHLPVQSGQRPGAEGNEPQPHHRKLLAPARARACRTARHRAVGRFHRRLPRRNGSRVRGDAVAGRCGGICRRRSASSTAPAPARRRQRWTVRSRQRSWTNGSSGFRPRSTAINWPSTRRVCRPALRCSGGTARQAARPVARQIAVAAIGAFHRRRGRGRSPHSRPGRSRTEFAARPRAGKSRSLARFRAHLALQLRAEQQQ
jgi:hypothetical protein